MPDNFSNPKDAARALILSDTPGLNWKAGSFLGSVAVCGGPLSPKQGEWLRKLLERAGLPPLVDGGGL